MLDERRVFLIFIFFLRSLGYDRYHGLDGAGESSADVSRATFCVLPLEDDIQIRKYVCVCVFCFLVLHYQP